MGTRQAALVLTCICWFVCIAVVMYGEWEARRLESEWEKDIATSQAKISQIESRLKSSSISQEEESLLKSNLHFYRGVCKGIPAPFWPRNQRLFSYSIGGTFFLIGLLSFFCKPTNGYFETVLLGRISLRFWGPLEGPSKSKYGEIVLLVALGSYLAAVNYFMFDIIPTIERLDFGVPPWHLTEAATSVCRFLFPLGPEAYRLTQALYPLGGFLLMIGMPLAMKAYVSQSKRRLLFHGIVVFTVMTYVGFLVVIFLLLLFLPDYFESAYWKR